jgi:hypothetical protein
MNIKVELEIERPVGCEDVTDEELGAWVKYELGIMKKARIAEQLLGFELIDGIIERETEIGYI